MRTKLVILSIFALIFIGCAGSGPGEGSTFEQGKKELKQENWSNAQDKLKLFLMNNPGSEKADSAQYLLAESHYKNEKYLLAISEYRKLKNRYSYSDLVEKADYKIGLSYVKLSPIYQREQEYTKQAIQQFQNFIEKYPESDYVEEAEKKIVQMRNKLAKKLYSAGIQYKKMRRWRAALIYFNKTLDNYYDTPIARDAQVEKAYSLIKLRRFDEYKEVLRNIEMEYEQDDKEFEKIKKRLKQTYKEEQNELKKEKQQREGRF